MLKPLTAFRFFAALMVFTWHISIIPHAYSLGYIGVSFFFMLSGFILTFTYLKKLAVLNWRRIGGFYSARIAKVYPMHVLTLVLGVLGVYLVAVTSGALDFGPHHRLGFALNALLLQSYYPNKYVNFSYNGVAWSISVEMFFYLLFPFLLLLLLRLRRRLAQKWIGLIMLGLWLAMVALLASRHAEIDQWSIYVFPPARLFEFTAGMALGLLFTETATQAGKLSRLRPWHFTVAEAGVLALLGVVIAVTPAVPQSLRFGALLIPCWSSVIYVFAHQKGALSRAFSIRPLTYLGEISFSFYMIHQLVIKYMTALHFSNLTIYVGGLAVATALSALLFHTYEVPMRLMVKAALGRAGRRFAEIRPGQTPEVPEPVTSAKIAA